jgi:predicted SnoaL-like aldol condensation-catalyzing enzyme
MSKLKRGIVVLAVLPVVLWACEGVQSTARQRHATPTTREVIEAFENLAFVEREPRDAVLKYCSPAFVDHDPDVAGDRDSIVARLEKLDWHTGGPQREIKHLVIEGEYAVIHHHLVRKPGDRGIAAIDMFRVHDGLIVEHWDVLQPMPEQSVNPHAMF